MPPRFSFLTGDGEPSGGLAKKSIESLVFGNAVTRTFCAIRANFPNTLHCKHSCIDFAWRVKVPLYLSKKICNSSKPAGGTKIVLRTQNTQNKLTSGFS